jgi:Flp pilus assembly pilin Flp
MRQRMRALAAAADGAVMVEFTIIAALLLTVTCGMVDFSLALYQWNAASKATELGGRLAAVSDPVSSDLSTLTGLGTGVNPGDPMPYFKRVCSGSSQSCSNGGTYSAAAMNTIVYGRGKTECGAVASGQLTAMCDVYPGLTTSHVTITYEQTGLGFAGSPDGVAPTVTVEVAGMTFDFVFLNGLLGFARINMPTMRTTITGEDLSTCAIPTTCGS